MKTRVAVFFGGQSVEHEVSVISGIQAVSALDTNQYDVIPVYISKDRTFHIGESVGDIDAYRNISKLLSESTQVTVERSDGRVFLVPVHQKLFKREKTEIDVALPVVHGTNVEDGSLQGFFRTVGLPFAGCDVCPSAVGMDKYVQKAVLRDNDIPVLDCIILTSIDYNDMDATVARVESTFAYPVIVKPANLGSSVGIGVATDRDQLVERIDDAFLYARRVLVEPAITNLREINCSVLGDEDEAEASVCEEPLHTQEILSYEDKYLGGGGAKKTGRSEGMASVSRQIPANLPLETTAMIQDISVRAFRALDCSGVVRIDYLLDDSTGEVWFNEINTIPGSLAFYLWEATGLPYSEMLDKVIALALKRARRDEATTFSFDTNILNAQSALGAKGSKR